MKCSKCGFENREGAKFCGNCRTKLVLFCPSCAAENQPNLNFCDQCGQPLSTPSKPAPKDLTPKNLTFDEKLAKIQKYLPGNITEKILSQRNRIEGERKLVTVLFTDMAGYTTPSEKLDAEEVYSLMDQIYEILIHKVTEYGGKVNEFTGDGIMALFGAPIALEDAPQRAIRASLAIHQEIVQFNEKMRREKPGHIPLQMREDVHEAIRICTEMRFRPELALSRLQLAELLLDQYPEERADAIANLDFAITEFRDMKMKPSLERALKHKELSD